MRKELATLTFLQMVLHVLNFTEMINENFNGTAFLWKWKAHLPITLLSSISNLTKRIFWLKVLGPNWWFREGVSDSAFMHLSSHVCIRLCIYAPVFALCFCRRMYASVSSHLYMSSHVCIWLCIYAYVFVFMHLSSHLCVWLRIDAYYCTYVQIQMQWLHLSVASWFLCYDSDQFVFSI